MIAFSRKNKRKKVMSLTVLLAKRFGGEVARWRGQIIKKPYFIKIRL